MSMLMKKTGFIAVIGYVFLVLATVFTVWTFGPKQKQNFERDGADLFLSTVTPAEKLTGYDGDVRNDDIKDGKIGEKNVISVSDRWIEDDEFKRLGLSGITVKVLDTYSGEVVSVKADDYLCGVVAAEMPSNYPIDALKAQAVAARSYAMYRKERLMNGADPYPEHCGADVCTDYRHCKAYLSPLAAKEKWGEEWFNKYYENIIEACVSTSDEVVVYNGEIINAVFCAASSGKTESALDVWGSDIAYLVSVDAAEDKTSPWSSSSAYFTAEEMERSMRIAFPDAVFDGEPQKWIEDSVLSLRSETGLVKSMRLCGIDASGGDIREIFGLKSANFTLVYEGEKFVFTTSGYGHGVGLSQYGAGQLAIGGMGYKDILAHYYTGTAVKNLAVG